MPKSPLCLWFNLPSIAYSFLHHFLIVNASSGSPSKVVDLSARESSALPIFATPLAKSLNSAEQVATLSRPPNSRVQSNSSAASASVSAASLDVGALASTSSVPKASPMATSRQLPSPSPPPKIPSSQKDTPVVPTPTPSAAPKSASSKPIASKPLSSSARPMSSESTKASTGPALSSHIPGPPPTKPVESAPGSLVPSSGHSTSTTTSVTIVSPTASARTSTVTMQPATTLSKPLALTTTGPNGGETVTTPPLVTILSTSTESDGEVATLTHVVANPNFNGGQQLVSATGIHKPGVLAGVCVVSGVVLASLLVGILFCVRRNQRIRRRRRWLAGMQQQRPPSLPGDPFRDPLNAYETTGPEMRSVTQDDLGWNGSNNSHSPLQHEAMAHEDRNFGPVYSLYPDPYPMYNPVHHVATQGPELQRVGPAHATDLAVPAPPFKRHSLTPSTPSIYPVTLPPDEDDQHEAGEDMSPQELVSPKPPPRPPRSHLRESAKIRSYAPLTPPDSMSSSMNSQPPSPIAESRPQDILTRRTLLDIRTRPIA